MKKTIYTHLSLLLTLLLMGTVLGGCKKETIHPVQDNRSADRLMVVASSTHFDTSGGSGVIQLNQSGFTFKGESSWCQVVAIGDKGLKLEVAPNPLPKSRSTIVSITKGSEVVSVPVIQLGSSDDAAIENKIKFPNAGGTRNYSVHFDSSPTITLSEGASEWLQVEVVEQSLIVFAKPNYLENSRSATISIVAGLFSEIVEVTQQGVAKPRPGTINSANDVLGEYTFHFYISDNAFQQPAKLVKGSKANEVILKGLAVDFVLTVNTTDNKLLFSSAQKFSNPKLYLFYSSGLGENECQGLDILGFGDVVFEAPAMKLGDAYSFTFTSQNKDKCEVTDEAGEKTGQFKNPRGFMIFDSENSNFYFGPNDETGVFFDFSLVQVN